MKKLQVWFDPVSNFYRVYLNGVELPAMLGVVVKDQFYEGGKGDPLLTFDALCDVVNGKPEKKDSSSKCGSL
jgi:hypothetical protein